jgi:hypothetical protein
VGGREGGRDGWAGVEVSVYRQFTRALTFGNPTNVNMDVSRARACARALYLKFRSTRHSEILKETAYASKRGLVCK